jgi:hypothetical protein
LDKLKDIKNQLFYKTSQYGGFFHYYDKGFPEDYNLIYDPETRNGAQVVVNEKDLFDYFKEKNIELIDGKTYDVPAEIDMLESYPLYQKYAKRKTV